jgi:hypothetical protein
MTRDERLGALLFGTVIGVFGFLAMFITKNEAGTAIALLLAGALILVGLQGTQVLKLGGKDIGAELARREIAATKATETAEENPARAAGVIEGYVIGDPGARNDPVLARALERIRESQEYQDRLFPLLRQAAGPNASVRMSGRVDGPAELAILSSEENILIEPICTPDRALTTRDLDRVRGRVERREANAALIVTNSPSIYPDARRRLETLDPPVAVVYWTGEEGAQPIAEAVDALRERLGGSAG